MQMRQRYVKSKSECRTQHGAVIENSELVTVALPDRVAAVSLHRKGGLFCALERMQSAECLPLPSAPRRRAGRALGLRQPIPCNLVVGIELGRAFQRGHGLRTSLAPQYTPPKSDQRLLEIGKARNHGFVLFAGFFQIVVFPAMFANS